MRVLVSGASGLVGTGLVRALRARGDTVRTLVRRAPQGESEARWDPAKGTLDETALEDCDAVVHLAGENIGARRWNEAHRAAVLSSRVQGTRLLARAIARAAAPPSVFVSASAVGFYGDTGRARVDETGAAGNGFLADVCRAWETEARAAERRETRVVLARLGVVLTKEGGALAAMLTPFKLGLGGRIGDGEQGMSFISGTDVVRALVHCLDDARLRGPVNLTAPEPASNAELTRALGRALGRPTAIPVPGFALRLLAGRDMADEMLLAGSYVVPKALLDTGFRFEHPDVNTLLRAELART